MIPIFHLPPIPVVRTIKQGTSFRYRAESTWEPAAGVGVRDSKYDLTLLFLNGIKLKGKDAPPEEGKEGHPVTFRMERLDSWIDGSPLPQVRLAGVFGARIDTSGLPQELSMEGEAGLLGLPLLSWHFPASLGTGEYIVAPTTIAPGVTAEGSGRIAGIGHRARFITQLWIGPETVTRDKRVTRFEAISEWDLKSGRLVGAEGTVTQPAGTLRFKIVSR